MYRNPGAADLARAVACARRRKIKGAVVHPKELLKAVKHGGIANGSEQILVASALACAPYLLSGEMTLHRAWKDYFGNTARERAGGSKRRTQPAKTEPVTVRKRTRRSPPQNLRQ